MTAHQHGAHGTERRLAWALGLAATYMGAEAVGGWWTGSLALLADAGHMLADVFALSLSLLAARLARRPAGSQQTYGHHRTEVLAAMTNGILLVGVAFLVVNEALDRIGTSRDILGGPMVAIATGGLAVNFVGLWILRSGSRENLNIRGAWLHVASDALGSIGAITAGILIWAFGWTWADPAASVLIATLIVYASWTLLREAVAVLMEWAPAHVEVTQVEESILGLDEVSAVHDLHVWTISSGRIALSGHVVSTPGCNRDKLLQDVSDLLHERFQIEHSTIQIETEDFDEPGGVCFT
ncbi:MAG: cation diffusion facilitator family transporter [Myxococcota bacterium]|jgi:cobalt-zinc-cadmium efflux system protein|nr:cation transporter [Deltaproteobacteria bacterium]MCP4244368.1 cation transporter [bacterium]MDP6074846.1 cation diffusion facilitator family transporter [Myxococcota bacterium]MDP6244674.1 cation diffusion facilitator family transporter [Myxococcota bacterium]MDP7075245.1 cation diffusion facilitator family transporter [Myxococcota bacterium]